MAHITGGCLCGAVRYVVSAQPLPGRKFLCSCDDCQRYTGTAFLIGMAFPPESIEVTGEMATFTMPGGQSGEPMHRRFCRRCGSPILLESADSERKAIMAGTLDDKSVFEPEICVFGESAPSWVILPDGARKLVQYT
jgi:hypothetical protein